MKTKKPKKRCDFLLSVVTNADKLEKFVCLSNIETIRQDKMRIRISFVASDNSHYTVNSNE